MKSRVFSMALAAAVVLACDVPIAQAADIMPARLPNGDLVLAVEPQTSEGAGPTAQVCGFVVAPFTDVGCSDVRVAVDASGNFEAFGANGHVNGTPLPAEVILLRVPVSSLVPNTENRIQVNAVSPFGSTAPSPDMFVADLRPPAAPRGLGVIISELVSALEQALVEIAALEAGE